MKRTYRKTLTRIDDTNTVNRTTTPRVHINRAEHCSQRLFTISANITMFAGTVVKKKRI